MEKPDINFQEAVQAEEAQAPATHKGGFMNKLASMAAAGAILFSGAEKAQAEEPLSNDKAVPAQSDSAKMDAVREKLNILNGEQRQMEGMIDRAEIAIEVQDVKDKLRAAQEGLREVAEKHGGKEAAVETLEKQKQSLEASLQKAESRLRESENQTEPDMSEQLKSLDKAADQLKGASGRVSEFFENK